MSQGWGYQGTPELRRNMRTVRQRSDGLCYICRGIASEVDHIIPVSRGGTHDLENLAMICVDCHKRKSAAEAGAGKHRAWQRKARRPTEPHPGMKDV